MYLEVKPRANAHAESQGSGNAIIGLRSSELPRSERQQLLQRTSPELVSVSKDAFGCPMTGLIAIWAGVEFPPASSASRMVPHHPFDIISAMPIDGCTHSFKRLANKVLPDYMRRMTQAMSVASYARAHGSGPEAKNVGPVLARLTSFATGGDC